MSAVKPILYGIDSSPPVRIVKTIAKIIDLDYEYRSVDIFEGDRVQQWFREINPQYCVPTLDDNGKIIWECCAVATYLVDKYASDDSLYPKDLYLRAKCNQRLFFVNASVFEPHLDIMWSIFIGGDTEIAPHLINKVNRAFNFLEAFLTEDLYLVGDHFTIADIFAVITIEQLNMYMPLSEEKHPKTLDWLQRVKENVPFIAEHIGEFPRVLNEMMTTTMEHNLFL